MVKHKTTLVFRTPQFERAAEAPKPAEPPRTLKEWEDLRQATKLTLRAMGLRSWNDPNKRVKRSPYAKQLTKSERQALRDLGEADENLPAFEGKTLMLLPYEWFDHIPEGYLLMSINGRAFTFERSLESSDKRIGMLAYGILV